MRFLKNDVKLYFLSLCDVMSFTPCLHVALWIHSSNFVSKSKKTVEAQKHSGIQTIIPQLATEPRYTAFQRSSSTYVCTCNLAP